MWSGSSSSGSSSRGGWRRNGVGGGGVSAGQAADGALACLRCSCSFAHPPSPTHPRCPPTHRPPARLRRATGRSSLGAAPPARAAAASRWGTGCVSCVLGAGAFDQSGACDHHAHSRAAEREGDAAPHLCTFTHPITPPPPPTPQALSPCLVVTPETPDLHNSPTLHPPTPTHRTCAPASLSTPPPSRPTTCPSGGTSTLPRA